MIIKSYIPDLQWQADGFYQRTVLAEVINPIRLYYFDEEDFSPIACAVTYLQLWLCDERYPVSHDGNIVNIRHKDGKIDIFVHDTAAGSYPARIDDFEIQVRRHIKS